MGRPFILGYDEILTTDCIFYRMCRYQVALIEDYIGIIAVTQPCRYYRERRFVMKLDKLIYWDDTTLLQHYEEQVGGANEQAPNDRDGGAKEQVHHEPDLGADEQNSDQDGDADEQVPNDQDLGANEHNADQDGGANEQVPNDQDQGEILSQDCIHCRICRTRVAFVEDYVPDVNDLLYGGFFNRLFNVEVSEDERNYQVIDGKTLAHIYCLQCRMLLGWKLIAVSQPSLHFREGRFYMRLDKLIYWNDVTLLHFLFGIGGANEHAPDDQDGGADEQDHDQNVGANEQGPNDQDGGANEQNADQDGVMLYSNASEL